MPKRQDMFITIRTEGALLTSDLLARIADNDPTLSGLRPQDYHLSPGEKLSEMINRSWNRAMGAWAVFQEAVNKLPESDPGTTATRERWLLILFQELGFGRLQTTRALEANGKAFPISHEWEQVPIHLVGARVDLDHRTSGLAGAARSSPHSLLQEFLKASPAHLWGVVSNGRSLRLLRDNAALTRQAYVEFDLAAMMDGQVYPDFVLLWLLLHESRFEGEQAADCWLERWAKEAEAQGTRALEHLRDSVEDAIAALGRGFLAYPSNVALRERLRDGKLHKQDYYRELLRLVYRLLFLFVSEDRELLLLPDAPAQAHERYVRFYSIGRLRRLAERRRGTVHSDLYEGLKLVMAALDETGLPQLGLPALGSFLWSPDAVGDLGTSAISNRDLLTAIHSLAFAMVDNARRAIDYRNLGAEELGSVYESLLELHPDVNIEAARFELGSAAGHERKSTGSYYTPTGLIVTLLDTALDPVVEQAASKPEPERAILQLKVVDPACGSGHFLIAGAHRIAKRLATIRTGDDEPSPEAVRPALRDVIGQCIYGVDMNDMAVELCKVSLWMEALEPGKPLSFLDHHIVQGNSLLGATPSFLAAGIPDEAYRPIEGDDKTVAASLRKANAAERAGQELLDFELDADRPGRPLSALMASIDSLSDDSVKAVREKERRYEQLRRSPEAYRAKLAADAWCAAFFMEKRPGVPPITQSVVRRAANEPEMLGDQLMTILAGLAEEFHFHHWHLAFPDVFENDNGNMSEAPGGFDVVLGNPPWEKVKLQEKEWFASRHPAIASAPSSRRKQLIDALKREDPALFMAFRIAKRQAEARSHFVRASGTFPLTAVGDLNTYGLFAELALKLLSANGFAGVVVQTGIATDETYGRFFADNLRAGRLRSLYDFENRRGLFPAVHNSQHFCLLTVASNGRSGSPQADFVFQAVDPAELADASRHVHLSIDDVERLNPNSKTCPIFRSDTDFRLAQRVYSAIPVLKADGPPPRNPWGASLRTMFHMTNDIGLLREAKWLEGHGYRREGWAYVNGQDRWMPVLEGKMIDMHDTRAASIEVHLENRMRQQQSRPTSAEEHADPGFVTAPLYWGREQDGVDRSPDGWHRKWFAVLKRVTAATNERTLIGCIIPWTTASYTLYTVTAAVTDVRLIPCLLANACSFVADFFVRQKTLQPSLPIGVIEETPFLPPETYLQPAPWATGVSLASWVSDRVLELNYTTWQLQEFARDIGFLGPPFPWDVSRRFLLLSELDAAFFFLYGLSTQEVEYVLDSFGTVRRRDLSNFGCYRTKDEIMDRFRLLKEAVAQGSRYVSSADPIAAGDRAEESGLSEATKGRARN